MLCLFVASSLLVASTSSARAEEVPPDQRLQVTRASTLVGGGTDVVGVLLGIQPEASAGTTVDATISSCGRTIDSASKTVRSDGRPSLLIALADLDTPNPHAPTPLWPGGRNGSNTYHPIVTAADLLGPTWQYAVVVTHPGHDPYTLTGASRVEGLTPARTCSKVTRLFDTTIAVTRWSDLVGEPRSRRRFAVTRTIAPDAKVSYRWHVHAQGKRTLISKKRTVRLTRAHRGKYLEARVRVTQRGKRPVLAAMGSTVR